jgi:hypothetical protein
MAVTTVTEKGWFSRIIESIKSVVVGLALFVLAFPTLFMNEGCAVRIARSLEAGAKAVVSVPSNDKIDPAFEGKLVHMTGKAVAKNDLRDPALGVSSPAIKLSRSVEMYQWVEEKETKTEKKTGGKEVETTTYTYRMEWSSSHHDSDGFQEAGHENPGAMPYTSEEWHATDVQFGAFALPEDLISRINAYADLPVEEKHLASLPADLGRAKLSGTQIYVGSDPGSPEIGDLKIAYKIVKSDQPISVVAMQAGTTFARYQIPDGEAIALLEEGTVGAAQMFAIAQAENEMRTWIVRVVGFIMMFAGLMLIFKPLVVVADVLPLMGSMLEMGLGLFAGIVSFALSFMTISVAWIFYRPLIGIPLLMLAVASLVGGLVLAKKRKARA